MSPIKGPNLLLTIGLLLCSGFALGQNTTRSVAVVGDECRPLQSGDPPAQVGDVCVKVVGADLVINIDVSEMGCEICDTHICNLPYVSESDLAVENFDLKIPVDEAYDFVCGYDETSYVVAGHVTVQCAGEKFQAYYEVELECPSVQPADDKKTPEDGDCKTVFAYMKDNDSCWPNRMDNPQENCATCFQHVSLDGLYAAFYRWGWINGGFENTNPLYNSPSVTGGYQLELWASADECDISPSSETAFGVGTLSFDYDGPDIQVAFQINEGYELAETHVYVGNEILPVLDDGSYTVTPALYPYSRTSFPAGTTTDFYTDTGFSGSLFLVAHAVVCTTGPDPVNPGTSTPSPPDCNFECPIASKCAAPDLCCNSFEDCECINGYKKWGENCMKCKECPPNSFAISACPSGPEDCVCEEGFEKSPFGLCKPDECVEIECPPGSEPIPGEECIDSIDKCTTPSTPNPNPPAPSTPNPNPPVPTTPNPNPPVPTTTEEPPNPGPPPCDSDYLCPPFSKKDIECPRSFDDCTCDKPFVPKDDLCVCEKVCPYNSKRKRNVLCPQKLKDDCVCDPGYTMNWGECKPDKKNCKRCPEFSKKLTDCPDDVESDCECWDNYIYKYGQCKPCRACPANSKPNCLCPRNLVEDCDCKDGFTMNDNGVCKEDPNPPNPNPPPPSPPCDTCPENSNQLTNKKCIKDVETDCKCKRGFEMTKKGKCLPCDTQCPQNSDKEGKCVDDIVTECECVDDYKMNFLGLCIPCKEKCPQNSKKEGKCVADIQKECECEDGYKMTKENKCKPKQPDTTPPPCPEKCPKNSKKEGKCVKNIQKDCECEKGYKMTGEDKCKPKQPDTTPPPPPCPEKCPKNSKKEGKCVKNIQKDCECEKGYKMTPEDKCKPKPPEPEPTTTEEPPNPGPPPNPNPPGCEYECPGGEQNRIVRRRCPNDITDCKSDPPNPGPPPNPNPPGCEYECPGGEQNRIVRRRCPNDITDCKDPPNPNPPPPDGCEKECPDFSRRIVRRRCPVDIDKDCLCLETNSNPRRGTCPNPPSPNPPPPSPVPPETCPRDCPDGTRRRVRRLCPVDLERDCLCPNGQTKGRNGRCEDPPNRNPPNCQPCPRNSFATVSCVTNFSQCTCQANYIRLGTRCIPDPNPSPPDRCYTCPSGSTPASGIDCPCEFNDCACVAGYFRTANGCVPRQPQPNPPNCVACPEGSVSLGGCHKKIRDGCDCGSGCIWDRSGTQCIPDPNFPIGGSRVGPRRSSGRCISCGPNSRAPARITCPQSQDQCYCNEGFAKNARTGQCEG